MSQQLKSALPGLARDYHPTRTIPADRPLIGIANLDLALIVRQANDDFVTQCRAEHGVYGRSIYELVHVTMRVPLRRQFSRLVDGELDRFVTQLTPEGPITGELTGTAVRDATNQVAGVTVLMRIEPILRPRAPLPKKPMLTKVHAQILEGVALGASTTQLAGQLHLSRQGIEYHITSLLRKLDVVNRAALVAKAHALGLLRSDTWPPRTVSEMVSH